MDLQVEKEGNVSIVSIVGRLDTTNFHELEQKLVTLVDGGDKFLLLDCTQLEYISSSGLRVFLLILKKIGQLNGKLVICGLNSNISEIFVIAGFASYFNLAGNKQEALALFN